MQKLGFLSCLFLASSVTAQVSTTPNSREPATQQFAPKPNKKSGFYAPQRNNNFRHKKPRVTRTAQYEFYERVEKAAKEKQRILRILSKRAYSDPRYFGHKRIPKRRPPHKMRFCNECHIRH